MVKRDKITSNLLWRFFERCGAQIVTFVVSIVLARLLSPEEYGQIALITIIIAVLNVFVDSGLGNALIQKENADDTDFSTVFYFNIVWCLVLYFLLWIFAPAVGVFYNDNELVSLTRVLGITIIVSSVKNILQAYVSKNLIFKKFFFATLGGTIFSAITGVVMAYKGCGVWALVAQHLSNTIIDTLILWIIVKWRPLQIFSIKRLKILFSYGYKLLLSSLLNTIYTNIRQLIIGKYYSSADLAYYNRGKQFPVLIVSNINVAMDSVLFPVMSDSQNDADKLKKMLSISVGLGSFIIWPFLFGIAAVAKPLVSIILTDKWLPAVPFLIVLCFAYATFPIQTANLNVIKATGRSDVFLKLEIIESIFGIGMLLAVINQGPLWIAIMYLVSSIFNCIVIIIATEKLIGYSVMSQIKNVAPQLLLSGAMFTIVYLVQYIQSSNAVIVIQIVVGLCTYTLGAKMLKIEYYEMILNRIREFKKKGN